MWTAAAMFATGLFLTPPQLPPDTLVLLTGSEDGSYIEIGRILAEILEEAIPGLTIEVRPSEGSVSNILALVRARRTWSSPRAMLRPMELGARPCSWTTALNRPRQSWASTQKMCWSWQGRI